MHLAHELILGGHLGIKKATVKVISNFYWPGIQADIRCYCQSCFIMHIFMLIICTNT